MSENGWELRRRLFVDNGGGDEIVRDAGGTELQTFEKTPSRHGLVERLDKWQELYLKYGSGIGVQLGKGHVDEVVAKGYS